MGINIKIHNIKNIDDFEFTIPTEKGLYALTGENGSGTRSTGEVESSYQTKFSWNNWILRRKYSLW